jgi:hypothetical protein
MEIGSKYLAVQAYQSFEDDEGNLVQFEEKRIELEVLPKPERVIMSDGQCEVEEALPDHLKQDDWYLIRNLKTERTHWFCSNGYQIKAIT